MGIKQYISTINKRQQEIAKEIGCHASILNKFLNGWEKLPEKYIEKLCEVLKITRKEVETNKVNKK